MTKDEYRTMVGLQYDLARAGWHPSVAGQMIVRAARRVWARRRRAGTGMGKVHPTRRIRREDPGIPPRPRVSGGRCRRVQQIPGQEEKMWEELNRLRGQGWNIMDVGKTHGFPSVPAFYACPPGALPREAQPKVLQSTPWQPTMYVTSF